MNSSTVTTSRYQIYTTDGVMISDLISEDQYVYIGDARQVVDEHNIVTGPENPPNERDMWVVYRVETSTTYTEMPS